MKTDFGYVIMMNGVATSPAILAGAIDEHQLMYVLSSYSCYS
jgi:hypothetical protein